MAIISRSALVPRPPPLGWCIITSALGKIKQLGAKILADNCGQSIEKILKDFDRDHWMDAKESIAYGIVDGLMDKV